MKKGWDKIYGVNETDKRLYIENPHDCSNSITVAPNREGSITVSVSDEKAVGSYNENFECSVVLPAGEAEDIARFILMALGK